MRGTRIASIQKNHLKKGRGQGVGAEYKPFIQAHDNKVASEGWLTRHLGWKTRRIHHTLSEHERRYLYYLEWVDSVVDIREQFPLLPLKRTIEISEQLGIKHAHVDDVPVVMTTDFMLTLQTSQGLVNVVRTVKPASKLDDRTLELFEIERTYFSEQGIDWCIILDNGLPKTLIDNIEWMCEAKHLETRAGIDEELVSLVAGSLLEYIVQDSDKTAIGKLCLRCDHHFGLENGTCMFILQHMLANKRWGTDMEVIIKESKPLHIINLECIITNTNIG